MGDYSWLLATLFLPLFPMGMLFNKLFQSVNNSVARMMILLLWPTTGVWLLQYSAGEVPHWVMYWAMASALLYSFRMVVIRDMAIWAGFLASSSWALTWVAFVSGVSAQEMLLHVLAFSLPLVILILLSAQIEKRYETVYAGIARGLALAQPRLAGLVTITVLAVIGSPLFPGFLSMFSHVSQSLVVSPATALGITVVWLLWSWSGMRLLQELLVGVKAEGAQPDIGKVTVVFYGASLMLLIAAGLHFLGRGL